MSNRINIGDVPCYKCGESLDDAKITILTGSTLALVAHVTCAKCGAQSVVTATPSGTGSVPLVSDLEPEEVEKFLNMDLISYDEILDLHKELKGKDLCSLMQEKEQNLVKRQKSSEKLGSSLL